MTWINTKCVEYKPSLINNNILHVCNALPWLQKDVDVIEHESSECKTNDSITDIFVTASEIVDIIQILDLKKSVRSWQN